MNHPNRSSIVVFALLSTCLVAGCGGSKVLKEAQPMHTAKPLASISDHRVDATLDWVIVRDGPGTWAKNADWDEYLLRVRNRSDQPISVTQLVVVDSLETRIEPQSGRKQLVKNSRQTARRYKTSGIKVKAGRGAGTMLVTGAAVTVVGVGAAHAAAYGAIMSGASTTGTAGAAAGGLLLLGPALAVGGIVRGINHGAVNDQIELRQTTLPVEIPAGEELELTLFFPLAPLPKVAEISYSDATGLHSLAIDTSTALDGLHIVAPVR